ncbi:MAG: DegT/DnrJ/EryC1/StrS family aminotransferase [Planctomycetota bacterium]|nr:DegT/DnrJ/EryC1/StrS family aminotransferase [Planctomycetota bacterium]
MMSRSDEKLAINGGSAVREKPFPPRRLFGEEEKAAAIEVFDESIAAGEAFGYGGKREQAYEAEFAERLGGGFAKAVNSGTSAILSALASLELEPESEVICPPITDPGGVMPIVMMNCVPVPADTNEFSFNTGPEQVAAAITDRTRAIIVAQIMGEPVDMDPIMEIARRKGLPVIEDAAQAHGATYKGRFVGTCGDIAAFSTMFGKHFASGGQGGIFFTRNEEMFWKARRFMDRGKPFGTDESTNVRLGLNLNTDELSAAIGRVQLGKMPWIVERRQAVAGAIAEGIESLQAVSLGRIIPDSKASYWHLRMTVDTDKLTVDKDAFAEALAAEGIPIGVSYRHIPAEHLWFRNRNTYGSGGYPWRTPYEPPNLPNCEAVTASNFLIHIHENWTDEEIDDTVAGLTKVEKAFLTAGLVRTGRQT